MSNNSPKDFISNSKPLLSDALTAAIAFVIPCGEFFFK